ncbi:ribonuclease E activity regulator RraA [Spongiactinospora sp. 9N601]|uniref:ribonuclease E activity regulator RraA n=1 Tax=Spongiactinospora sp. 9N601 TaxID=3375149 RepID=UPI0037A5C9FB
MSASDWTGTQDGRGGTGPPGPSKTGDLADARIRDVQVLSVQMTHFGAVREFGGTVETVEVDDDNALVRRVLEGAGEGRVLVIDAHATTRCAISGPTHVELALEHGWSGIIVNGPIRYVRWLAGMPFGIMALGSHPRQPAKTGAGVVGRPVRFGGVTFIPGSHLWADDDGVVVVPWR